MQAQRGDDIKILTLQGECLLGMTSQGSALNVIRDEQHGGVGAGGNGENDADCIGMQ